MDQSVGPTPQHCLNGRISDAVNRLITNTLGESGFDACKTDTVMILRWQSNEEQWSWTANVSATATV